MDEVRSGQWTPQEIKYATRLIEEFRKGSIDLPEGTSMRGFLAEKLLCCAKRVSKKYENTNYNGRLLYARDKSLSAEVCVRTRLELEKLERLFHESVRESKAAKTASSSSPSSKATEKECKPKTKADTTKTKTRPQERSASSLVNNHSDSHSTAFLQARSRLEQLQALERNAAAASETNDKILSILAARRNLAQQHQHKHQHQSLRSFSTLPRNQSLSVFPPLHQPQQQRQQHQPAMAERLRFLRQIELEKQQRLFSSNSAATTPNTQAAKRWDTSLFQEQARSLALSHANNTTAATTTTTNSNSGAHQPRKPQLPYLARPWETRTMPGTSNETMAALKRIQPSTNAMPDSKRSRPNP